ncbi:uncharacterized protein PG986_004036 [Apiospora aurea]|uniref:F-box domain-containing protein n=1 Tax=Apiospora aurea TaxID=335848 RepID=A0ABR1QLF6_9PEZI
MRGGMEQTSFFSLPRETRDQIYQQCLLPLEALQPLSKRSWTNRGFAIPLLRTNKTVHTEACPVFYGQNRFAFPYITLSGDIDAFLQRIGSRNAGSIRHVRIPFPLLQHIKLGGRMALRPDDVEVLASLQRGCPELRTLSTDRQSTHVCMKKRLLWRKRPVRREALGLADAHFRSIPPLMHVIVQVDEFSLFDKRLEDVMRRMEWTISAEDCRLWNERMEDPAEWKAFLKGSGEVGPYSSSIDNGRTVDPRAVDDDGNDAWTDTDSDSGSGSDDSSDSDNWASSLLGSEYEDAY